jgi:hypothetical protein
LLKNAEGSVIHKSTSGGAYLDNYDGSEETKPLFWIPYAGIRACGSDSKPGNIGTMTAHFDGDQYGHSSIYPRGYYWYTDLGSNAETAILIGGWNLSGSALSSSNYHDASYYIYICFGGTINSSGSVSNTSSNIYDGGKSRALMLAMSTPIRCVKE